VDEGIALFSKISKEIKLKQGKVIGFANDFVQESYTVNDLSGE
jgi:hypothetical protein